MDNNRIEIYVDGASKGNNDKTIPSKAYTCVLIPEKSVNNVTSIGDMTNNEAEWLALIEALTLAHLNNWNNIKIYSDSQLIINQFIGKYQCKDERMKIFYQLAREYNSKLNVEIEWVPREKNLAGIELERRF